MDEWSLKKLISELLLDCRLPSKSFVTCMRVEKYPFALTLLLADSYMSPSTLRAYATRFSMRRSLSAAGSGVGNMACTLRVMNEKKINLIIL